MSKLTVTIPDDLHQQIRDELERQGITTSQFIEQAITTFFEKPKGVRNMATRTLAFQVSEELLQRIKTFLARYEQIYHRKLSQKEFLVHLIERELDEAEKDYERITTEQAAEENADVDSGEPDGTEMEVDLDERCRGKVFPFTETAGSSLIQTHGGHQGERVYSPEGLSCTLAANPGGFGGKTGLYEVGVPIKCATKTGYQMAQVGDGIDLSYATVNSRRGRVGKEIAHTLTTGCQQGTVEVRPVKNPIKSDLARNTERTGKPGAPMHTLTTKDRHGVLCEGRIRRLTPRECLRLQGWADDRIDTVLAIQSDNQAYKQAGNGVTVHVVEAIGRRIAKMDAELRGEALAP